MADKILSTKNLTKKYNHINAISDVNMDIYRGDIYGFVGMNGAGKTTLLRILAGAASPTSGGIELFGETECKKLYVQRKRMNGMIEKPALYPDLTARSNLEICRLQRGISDKSCINEVLEMVEFEDDNKKKVKNYSLGMKQRLGLAMAILGYPELLCLDEPANGLDPVGIIGLRTILKKLNHEHGTTILISSHLLSELHQLSTCYGFIHKGRLIEQITSEALDEKCKKYLQIKVDDVSKAILILTLNLKAVKYEIIPDNIIHLYEQLDKSRLIMKELVLGGVDVEEINIKGTDLEKYYISLIKGKRNEEPYKGRIV